MNELTDLYSSAVSLAEECGSLYRDTRTDRARLLLFMDAWGWFGQPQEYRDGVPFTVLTGRMKERLRLWLRACGRGPKEKLEILFGAFEKEYPDTCGKCRAFLDREKVWDSPASLQAGDFLVHAVLESGRELSSFSGEDLHRMLCSSEGRLTKRSFARLQELTGAAAPSFSASWTYTMGSLPADPEDLSAYPAMVYAGLAWLCFNEDSWKARGLPEKARGSAPYARRWLFLAMHYFTGIRAADLERLPPPVLDLPYEEAALAILDADAPEERDRKAVFLSSEWERQLSMLSAGPGKTLRYKDVPALAVFIPASLKAPVGFILACALLHYRKGSPLMAGPFPVPFLRSFFGQEALDLTGGRGFGTRRANKAYLQGLAAAASGGEGSMEGYVIAAMARSHKGGLRLLPATTDIYLRDANFTGLSPGYVLFQLFERGVFGWVPVLLLETYRKKDFRSITVRAQTDLIRSLCLTPLQMERLSEACAEAETQARAAVSALFAAPGGPDRKLREALSRLSAGRAPAKQEGLLCLQAAAGLPCPRRESASCMGCGSSVPTAAFVHSLMGEYVLLCGKARTMDAGPEKDRLTAIATKGVMPVLMQLRATFRALYPDAGPGADALITSIMKRALLLVLPGTGGGPSLKGGEDEAH